MIGKEKQRWILIIIILMMVRMIFLISIYGIGVKYRHVRIVGVEYMHDNYIIDYTVNLSQKKIVLTTYNKSVQRKEIVYFDDVLTHEFKCILEYNQILDINSYDIESFFNENRHELKLLHCSCWPINYSNLEELKKYLIENKYQYIKINSSYGMYGWIIAKDYTIKL